MGEPRQRTLNFKRAEYYVENKNSVKLSACIVQAIEKRTTIPEKTIPRGSGQYIILAHSKADGHKSVFLHLVIDTPGDPASIVPTGTLSAKQIDVGIASPPKDAEFMDGDAFVYICGNDVCFCATAVTASAIEHFLHEFLRAANVRRDADSFSLVNAVDVAKIAILEKRGVKEIEIRAVMQSASLHRIRRKSQAFGIFDGIWKQIKALAGQENDVSEDALKVSVTLVVDGRIKGGIVLGQKRLQAIAKDVIQNQEKDDEYCIVTNDGIKINPSDIILKAKATIEGYGKSLNREKAWTELNSFYNILHASGALTE